MIVDVVTFLHVSPVSVASHVSPCSGSADGGWHSLQCMVQNMCSVSCVGDQV